MDSVYLVLPRNMFCVCLYDKIYVYYLKLIWWLSRNIYFAATHIFKYFVKTYSNIVLCTTLLQRWIIWKPLISLNILWLLIDINSNTQEISSLMVFILYNGLSIDFNWHGLSNDHFCAVHVLCLSSFPWYSVAILIW